MCGFVIKTNSDKTVNLTDDMTKEKCDAPEEAKVGTHKKDCPKLREIFENCLKNKPEVELGPETPIVNGEGAQTLSLSKEGEEDKKDKKDEDEGKDKKGDEAESNKDKKDEEDG